MLPEKDWPTSKLTSSLAEEEAMKEIVKNPRMSTHDNVEGHTSQSVNTIINYGNLSSFSRLFRVTAFVLGFIKI